MERRNRPYGVKHSIQHLFYIRCSNGCPVSGCNNGRGCPVILSRRRWFFAKKLFLQEKHCSSVQSRLNWKAAQCRKVLSFLPVLRENRKNIQYLTQDEVRLLRKQQKKAKFLHVIGRFSSCSFLRGFGVVTSPGLLSVPLTGKLNRYWSHSRKHPYP